MTYKIGNQETHKVLTRNAVKCLVCNTVLESKHRHDFKMCSCLNSSSVDGGLDYQRISAKDLDLIENLCEYIEMTDDEYAAYQHKLKIQMEQQRNAAIDRFLMYTLNLPNDKG